MRSQTLFLLSAIVLFVATLVLAIVSMVSSKAAFYKAEPNATCPVVHHEQPCRKCGIP